MKKIIICLSCFILAATAAFSACAPSEERTGEQFDKTLNVEIGLDPSQATDVSLFIYGQFIEHFGRQVYGGIYDPGHPLSDADGFRRDVIAALRRLRIPVMRWPGGCFVSAYHWKDGVGRDRMPAFDKAWCVEESNAFGTDEFMLLCR